MNRLNQILIAIFLVQLAVVGWMYRPNLASPIAPGGALYPDFDAEAVTSLTLSDGEGNELAITRTESGWVLADADGFPVREEPVETLLTRFGEFEANRLVTQTEGSHARLEVAPDAFNRLVELTLDDDSTERLYIGSSTTGGTATHVRVNDQPEVYLVDDLRSWEVEPDVASWIDTLYFTVPLTSPVKLTLENANGTFAFEKVDDAWTMPDLDVDGKMLGTEVINTLSNQVTSVRMARPLGQTEDPSYGLDEPLATVTLVTDINGTEETHTIELGAFDEAAGEYILKASTSPYYVAVTEFTGNNFLDKTLDSFLVDVPEEPTPEASSVEEEPTQEFVGPFAPEVIEDESADEE